MMPVKSLELISQIAAAQLYWQRVSYSESDPIKYWIKKIRKIKRDAEMYINSQVMKLVMKSLLIEGLKIIEETRLQYLSCFNMLYCDDRVLLGPKWYARNLKLDDFMNPRSEHFADYLTADSKFDNYKFVRDLVNDCKRDSTIRLLFACYYCFEDYTRQNWQQFTELPEEILQEHKFLEIWSNYINGVSDSDIWSSHYLDEIFFMGEPAVRFFWNIQTLEEKEFYTENVSNMLELFGRSDERHVQFLFQCFTPDKQNSILEHYNQTQALQENVISGLLNPSCDFHFFKFLWNHVKDNLDAWESLEHICFLKELTCYYMRYDVYVYLVKYLTNSVKSRMETESARIVRFLYKWINWGDVECFLYVFQALPYNLKQKVFMQCVNKLVHSENYKAAAVKIRQTQFVQIFNDTQFGNDVLRIIDQQLLLISDRRTGRKNKAIITVLRKIKRDIKMLCNIP